MPLDPHEVQAETVRYLVAKNQELAAEVARLTAALAAAQAAPVVEWTTVGRSFVAVVGSMEMIVMPDGTPSVWSFGWQLSITGTHSNPFCVILDSGTQTGDAGKAACIAAYRKAAGL